jgi:hypothetical protein
VNGDSPKEQKGTRDPGRVPPPEHFYDGVRVGMRVDRTKDPCGGSRDGRRI